jgi:LCP family protein required for cell wall assembly
VIGAVIVVFLISACLTAYLAFLIVRDAVAGRGGDSPAVFTVSEEGDAPLTLEDVGKFIDINTPLQAPDGPAPEGWDGQSRVNVLFIGVDHREWEPNQGPPLADTLILATYDPPSRSAAMLSIPRDLWVELPGGLGYHKINQSFQMGEATNYPGGGAGMTIDTVEQVLAVPVHFYVLVDFNAFIRLIDEIGGVKINVPEAITVDPLGDNNTITLQPGVQTLPGDIALAYARARNTAGSDFDRAARQQQIIMGVYKRVTDFGMLPTLIAKSPVLYQELASGVSTNLSVRQIFDLAWQIQQLPEERIRRYVIGPEQVIVTTSYNGLSILQIIPDKLLMLRDEVFSTAPPPAPTEIAAMSVAERAAAESARISLQNGTLTTGLAARTDTYLQSKGITAAEVSNADSLYRQTTIVDYSGKPATVEYLAQLLNVVPSQIYHSYDPNSEFDVVVILGEDWAANDSLP